MIKESVYEEMAHSFGISVGVAHTVDYKTKKEVIKEDGVLIYKQTKDELTINNIISDCIYFEMYHELQREVYKIKQNKNRKLKESTIYRRAYNELMQDDEEDNTKF